MTQFIFQGNYDYLQLITKHQYLKMLNFVSNREIHVFINSINRKNKYMKDFEHGKKIIGI